MAKKLSPEPHAVWAARARLWKTRIKHPLIRKEAKDYPRLGDRGIIRQFIWSYFKDE